MALLFLPDRRAADGSWDTVETGSVTGQGWALQVGAGTLDGHRFHNSALSGTTDGPNRPKDVKAEPTWKLFRNAARSLPDSFCL